MVEAKRWKFKPLTPIGGRSSSMKVNNSSTSKMEKHLMYIQEKTKKEEKLSSTTSIPIPTKNGRLSILMKLIRLRRKEWFKNSDCMPTDHSI